MVIRSSSARDIERLVTVLGDGSPVERDAAIARLRVIGPRAVDRLATLVRSHAPDAARAAALKALEGIDHPRARDVGLDALTDARPAVALAAVATCRPWLAADEDARVLDAITALALDRARDPSIRLAALDALAELPGRIIQPLLERVGADDPALAARKTGQADAAPALDSPAGVREWLALRGSAAALSEIHQVIVNAREHELNEPSAQRRQDWQVSRAAAHEMLARRGSRVALYDLRETFEGAREPLPLAFLQAAALIGDATCLEPLAGAWAARRQEPWWRDHLAETARAIVKREKLTGRHAVVKRVRARFAGLL